MLNFLPPTKAPTLYNHTSRHDYWTSRSLNPHFYPDVPIQSFSESKPPHATRKAGSETCNVDTGNTARSDSAYLNRSVVNYAPTHPSLSAPPSGFGSLSSVPSLPFFQGSTSLHFCLGNWIPSLPHQTRSSTEKDTPNYLLYLRLSCAVTFVPPYATCR